MSAVQLYMMTIALLYPPYAAAALSFYLLLLLIPAFTLIAIGTITFLILI